MAPILRSVIAFVTNHCGANCGIDLDNARMSSGGKISFQDRDRALIDVEEALVLNDSSPTVTVEVSRFIIRSENYTTII